MYQTYILLGRLISQVPGEERRASFLSNDTGYNVAYIQGIERKQEYQGRSRGIEVFVMLMVKEFLAMHACLPFCENALNDNTDPITFCFITYT